MIKLTNRLNAVASLVGSGTRLADIGCDHGFIVAKLLLDKKIISAVAADINEGPLSSCKELINKYSLNDYVTVKISDGLQNVKSDECDDIVIAGMGGDLIANILEKCPYINEKHLILQPMTHSEIVRKWLFDNGFEINNDIVIKESKHSYCVFDASYCGSKKQYDDFDLFVGNVTDFSNTEYYKHLINYLRNKEKSGFDYSDLIKKIEEKI